MNKMADSCSLQWLYVVFVWVRNSQIQEERRHVTSTHIQLRAMLPPARTLCVLIKDSPQEGWSLKSWLVRSSLHMQWRTYIKGRPELLRLWECRRETAKKPASSRKASFFLQTHDLRFRRCIYTPHLKVIKNLRSWEQKAWSTKTYAAQGLVTAQLIMATVSMIKMSCETRTTFGEMRTLSWRCFLTHAVCCAQLEQKYSTLRWLLDIYPLEREVFMVWTPMQEFIPFAC